MVAGGLVLAACYAIVAQSRYPGGGDAPYHLLTARAWFGDGGFGPDDPTQTKYPPGWSLALGLAGLLIGDGYSALARFTAALFPLLLFASWLFIRRYSCARRANWITLALALSPACFDVATKGARSEVLFTSASMAFLAWHVHATQRERLTPWRVMLASTLLVAAVMLRTIGVALLLASIATVVHVALFERQRLRTSAMRLATPILVSSGAEIAWKLLARATVVEKYPGERMNLYSSQFHLIDPHRPLRGTATTLDVLARIPGNLRMLTAHAAEMLTNLQWISPLWTSPVVISLLVVLLAGVIHEMRRTAPLVAYYLLAYVGILTVWPFDEGQRFLVPIAPLLFLFATSGMALLARAAHTRPRLVARFMLALPIVEVAALSFRVWIAPDTLGRQSAFALLFWFAALVAGVVGRRHLAAIWTLVTRARLTRFIYRAAYVVLGISSIYSIALANWRSDHGIENGFQATSKWIAEHTAPDAIVMAQRHLDFVMTTGRPGAVFPVTGDPVRLVTALKRTGTRYLIVYDAPIELAYYFPVERDRFNRIQSALNGALKLRVHDQDVSVYELPPLH